MSHYPSHLRRAFDEWVLDGCRERVRLRDTQVDFVHAWRWDVFLAWFRQCSDTMPSNLCGDLDMPQGCTYGEAALFMLEHGRGPAPYGPQAAAEWMLANVTPVRRSAWPS